MNALSAHGLSFAYHQRPVLKDASFAPLEPGRLVALIGPNAAGKSTLFRVLAGLLRAKEGEVRLGETNLATLPLKTRLRRVCYMPQFFSANAALTVFDVVLMAKKQLAGWRVTPEDTRAVAEALEQSGIGHLAQANISELSGGQAQMVSICQALVREAEVFLFDEPTSALDLRHQLEVLGRIRAAMVDRGTTGIVALHDLNLAARFADEMILIGEGRILAQGPPEVVLRQPVIADTYNVEVELLAGRDGALHVSAFI